jgi:hypothetical protein
MKRTHGDSAGSRHDTNRSTPEMNAWKALIQRCVNQRNPQYRNYGGRGITVCVRWLESFENFLADMGRRPSADHSIDRINNDGHYEPGNCRWTTGEVQRQNRRSSGPPSTATPEQIAEVRRRLDAGERPSAIERALSLSRMTVRGIRRRHEESRA